MTRTEMIRQVLENLQIVDAINPPSAEDAEAAGRRLDQETATLREQGLMWWTADAIPDSVAQALSELVAERAAPTFGKQYASVRALARIAAVKSSAQREAQRGEYF
jgi:hypothetical protein